MNEGGNNTGRFLCSCHNRRNQSSPALRESSVPTDPRRASYHMNTFTSPAAGSPNHLYNEIPSTTFQSQMSSYLPPAYVTPIFRSTYGQVYNGTYSRPSTTRGPVQIRSYTPPSSMTWAPQDTFEDLHSQTTPDTVALSDPNNWIYRINNLIPSETRTLTNAPQGVNSTMPLNDLPVIRQTLDVISSGSTFPTQPSSTLSSYLVSSNNPPSLMSSTAPNTPQLSLSANNPPYLMSSTAPNTPQLSLSANNPPSLMSSTAPNTPQLSLNIPSATLQESPIDSSNQDFEVTEIAYVQRDSGVNSFTGHYFFLPFTLEFNNNTNEHMAGAMDYTEGNSESEAEVDRNLREEVSMPEEEIIDHRMELCPHNDNDECDDDCPYLHGQLCHLCHTHRFNPYNAGLHFYACLEQHKKQSKEMECNICMEKITEMETDRYFGILENCSHCFCIRCLLTWRRRREMANYKACPVCRTPSEYILGFKFWIVCPLSKKKLIECRKRRDQERRL